MNQNKLYKLICSLWIIVPVLSLVRLSRPTMQICMGAGIDTAVAMPVKMYNGLQLLFHGTLVNGYNAVVIDIRNIGFVVLKIIIALQVIFDLVILFLCIQEWRKKQRTKIFLRIRGMISVGYVLTAVAIYKFIPICGNHLQVEHYHSISRTSYAYYFHNELEKNIYLSIAVVVLFLVTWSFCNTEKAYRRMCYFWILVPILSLVILSGPMIVIQTDDIYPITDMEYSGFQMLAYGSLVNKYKDLVIDRGNLGFVIIKVMIALQLVFDLILVIIVLWEWRKKQNPKRFLFLREGLAVGYMLTAATIYRVVEEWSDHLEIEHDLFDGFLTRTSCVIWEWGAYMMLPLSITAALLFAVSLLAFCLSTCKKRE